jgi:putative pyruvate formate lyase activating enzyme
MLTNAAQMRPDAISVWKDPTVNSRLFWYRQVMIRRVPPKFMLCRTIPSDISVNQATEQELWDEHKQLSSQMSELIADPGKLPDQETIGREKRHPNFLDVKSALVSRMLEHCNFCEWNCKVNRADGKVGFCRLDSTTSVASHFHHHGEEAPLIGVKGQGGSGTVFFESCTARCVYCQNWDISQPKNKASIVGETVTSIRLAEIADQLAAEGAANINYVGGEPTPNLHTIVDSLNYMTQSVPLIWNSNMYCTMETMKILADVIDLWLPDFKFWKDECARRLMLVGSKASYPEVAKRNHVFAARHGSMIIRHLVMPNHIECCTKPILTFIANTVGSRCLVNIMSQYYPANMVTKDSKYAEIARYPRRDELEQAFRYAHSLGLEFNQVSVL